MLKQRILKTLRKNSMFYKNLSILVTIIAFIIAIFVLFSPPMPGVADQGDFQRVMTVTSLEDIQNSANSPDPHWFKYVTTNYKMAPLGLINTVRLTGVIPTTSMIYPILLARIISRLTGGEYFNTRFLAFIYVVLHVFSLFICLRCIKFRKRGTAIFFSFLSIFILMDGSYLIWFNSMYGEAMITVSLILFVGAVLYTSQHLEHIGYKGIILVFISALLFLGSKLQCFVALPLMIYMINRTAMLQETRIKVLKINKRIVIPIIILIYYVGGIYIQTNSSTGVDTEFNSVFYGVLKNSDNPEKDLEALGLPTDMALEAGKHAYLPKEEYVKYVPWSDITKREFNDKISNFKLLRFYLSHPKKLLKGMEYTASKAFDTLSSLGKYEKSVVEEYTYTFERFTYWSKFRSSKIPRTLSFLIPFYILVIIVSIFEYMKRIRSKDEKFRIELFWVVLLIGVLQFPMPYLGNGEADTAKQLFLFNYTFDLLFLVTCTWIFDKLYSYINKTINFSKV